ncbi:MAG: hypothetical protein ABW328_18145 [Ilumatobacteraceae bacterium]
MSSPTISAAALSELALDLVSDLESGDFAAHDAAVRDVIRAARARNVSPVLVEVLGDPREPPIARLRAFGTIASALTSSAVAEAALTFRSAA